MQTLIGRCLRRDAHDRPSFGEIFETRATADFKVFLTADESKIRGFANETARWESGSATRKSGQRV
jgi:hypothetical protein